MIWVKRRTRSDRHRTLWAVPERIDYTATTSETTRAQRAERPSKQGEHHP